ncbi:LysE family translocator [Alphaproteobacteria bacterium HT1-32]|nr:LysE family translocator [Alphaproteobacteria bacterium HT1-32]
MSEALIPLIVFVSLMVGTPGPANLLIMTGGATYGVRACMPFNLGLICGKIALNVAVGLGLGVLITRYPLLQTALKFISGGYMIWLAMQSWNSVAQVEAARSAYSFRKGLIVHPLNPKAWVMTLLAWSDFAPAFGDLPTQMLVIVTCFAVAQAIFHTGWCIAGGLLGHAFHGSLILSRTLIVITVTVVVGVLLS